MYAQLGDIVFDLMLGFSKYEDTRASNYAEISLINGKPRLQRVGERLIDVSFSIKFATKFCIPENEFARLNKKRIDGEVLTFIWGNGDVEGDFVITEMKRNINALSAKGSFADIDVDVTLKEYYSPNKIDTKKKDAQKNAFAVDLNSATSENIELSEPSTATDAMSNIFDQDRKANTVSNNLTAATKRADAFNAAIDKAQSFVDDVISTGGAITGALAAIIKLQTALTGKLVANPTLSTIAPGLPAALNAAQTVISAADILVTSYASLPNPVSNLSEANNVLGVMAQTVSKTADVVNAMKNLKDASAPLAIAIATGKDIDT